MRSSFEGGEAWQQSYLQRVRAAEKIWDPLIDTDFKLFLLACLNKWV